MQAVAEVGKKHPAFKEYQVVKRVHLEPDLVREGIDDCVIVYRDGVYFVSNRFTKSKLYTKPVSLDV